MSDFNESKIAIQTLFKKLTELILIAGKTRADINNLAVAVGNWAAVVFASLVVMIEGEDQTRAFKTIDKITDALNSETKKHLIMIRGLKKKVQGAADQPTIVTPP